MAHNSPSSLVAGLPAATTSVTPPSYFAMWRSSHTKLCNCS